jgi:hypothetical protein
MVFHDLHLQAKDFQKILQRITAKKSQRDNKQVIVGFGNKGNHHDGIKLGHCRGPVQEVKNKLQKWCGVVDVDEFYTSKLCSHCCCEVARSSIMEKKSIMFSNAVTTSVE